MRSSSGHIHGLGQPWRRAGSHPLLESGDERPRGAAFSMLQRVDPRVDDLGRGRAADRQTRSRWQSSMRPTRNAELSSVSADISAADVDEPDSTGEPDRPCSGEPTRSGRLSPRARRRPGPRGPIRASPRLRSHRARARRFFVPLAPEDFDHFLEPLDRGTDRLSRPGRIGVAIV